MADAVAQSMIQTLLARGLSGKAIAGVVGRNDSMISQIGRGARGAGYGRGLVPALRELERATRGGGNVRNVASGLATSGRFTAERRITRKGTPAAVRSRARRAGAGGWYLKTGRLDKALNAGASPGASPTGKAIANRLRKAPADQPITIKLHGLRANGLVSTVKISGLTAGEWVAILDGEGDDGIEGADDGERTPVDVMHDVMWAMGAAGELASDALTKITGVEAWGASEGQEEHAA